MMKHETNTFSPVRTDLARFARVGNSGPDGGAAAIAAYRGTGTVTGAYIEIAEREGAQFELVIAADAWPSGPVEDEAYEIISDAILAAVRRGGWDGILLDLHGAMVTRSHDAARGQLRHARQRIWSDGCQPRSAEGRLTCVVARVPRAFDLRTLARRIGRQSQKIRGSACRWGSVNRTHQ